MLHVVATLVQAVRDGCAGKELHRTWGGWVGGFVGWVERRSKIKALGVKIVGSDEVFAAPLLPQSTKQGALGFAGPACVCMWVGGGCRFYRLVGWLCR